MDENRGYENRKRYKGTDAQEARFNEEERKLMQKRFRTYKYV